MDKNLLITTILLVLLNYSKCQRSDFRQARQLNLDANQSTSPKSEKPVDILKGKTTNLDRSYLPPNDPPIQPAAAKIDETVIKPEEEHHYGRDFCTDPFHSFLCVKPKPRKRITGALPQNLVSKYQEIKSNYVGANSIPQPSKVLSPPVEDEASSSALTAFTPTILTIFTTPKITTETIPIAVRSTTMKTTTLKTFPITVKTTSTTEEIPAPSNDNPSFIPLANVESGAYLPPVDPAPSNVDKVYTPPVIPAAAAAAANEVETVVKPENDHHHHHEHRNICSDPFHSFLCTPLKPRTRITGALPNTLIGQNSKHQLRKVEPPLTRSPAFLLPSASNNNFRAEPNFENILHVDKPINNYLPPRLIASTTTTRRPTTTTITTTATTKTRRPTTTFRPPITFQTRIPAPSNEIEKSYLPPKFIVAPSNEVSRVITTTKKPITTTTTRKSTTTTTTRKPTTTTTTRKPTTTTTTTTSTTQRPVAQPTNNLRSYLPPETPKFDTAAAQNDVTIVEPKIKHISKDICSDPFHSFLCQTPKERSRITGSLPNSKLVPDTSNIVAQKLGFPTSTTTRRPSTTTTATTATTTTTTTTTIKPEIKENQPTNQVEIIYRADEVKKGYSYQNLPASAGPNTGYSYLKFSEGLHTTTESGYNYPKPENKQPLPSENVGYTYPKPSVPFPPSTTEQGYSYPKPENEFTLPTNTQEYTYPKPEVEFPAPTMQHGYTYPKPENGYNYKIPLVEFLSPSEQNHAFFAPNEKRISNNNPWIPIISNEGSPSDEYFYRRRNLNERNSYNYRKRFVY